MLNVYDERQNEIDRRRAACVARIARQRDWMEKEFQNLKAPVRTLEVALQAGAVVREHGATLVMVAIPLLLLARRPLAAGTATALALVRTASRWWPVWQAGASLLASWASRKTHS